VTVYKPGTEVLLKHAGSRDFPSVKAVISGVWLSESGVNYEIVWWDGKARHKATVDEFEVQGRPDERNGRKIGFHGENNERRN
jgi:hypothetical protein